MNLQSDKPIFQQVVEKIENEIIYENLLPEDRAPSTNEFSKIYSINPATARKGLNILVDEKILYKKRGLGMFVTKEAKDIVIKKRQNEFLENLLPELVREAKRLKIDKGQIIEVIDKLEEEN